MRRLAAIAVGLAAVALAAVAVLGSPATGADTYRVDALFDTAKGVIPGQLVKIAGARVGKIEDVALTRDHRARIVMAVPRRFSFREDASCTIQPEGLISENFVGCDPGTPGRGPLAGRAGGPPTVPVERTSVPVSLTDLFRIFQADVRQRFTVAVAAVGGGLAARGEDLNAILRRANPTLAAIRTLTRDLAAQREELARAVADTDRVVAALARRDDGVAALIEQADRVSARTARRRAELAEAVRRLPPLLDAADVAVGQLDRLATDGRPLLGRLRAAAPGLERLLAELRPFAAAGRPALRRLAETAEVARPVVRRARPLVRLLRPLVAAARPAGASLARTLVDLRDRGFVEHLNLFVYYGSAAQARYDAVSHIFPALPVFSSCSPYAERPVGGCNAFYSERSGRDRRRPPRARRRPSGRAPARPARPAPTASAAPAPPTRPGSPPVLPDVLGPVTELTDELTGGIADDLRDGLEEGLRRDLPGNLQEALPRRRPDERALEDLAAFLLER